MRALLLVLAGAAAAGAAWAGAGSFVSPPRQIVQFGYLRSIVPRGAAYELSFDPALWLQGETANRAAQEDGAVKPGEGVPNDYYILDPEHRLLTYRLPRTAPITVLVNTSRGIASLKIPVPELAQIVKGRNPRRRALLDPGPKHVLGYWLRTSVDTVRSLDQQYQP
jgi:hypothetical protein